MLLVALSAEAQDRDRAALKALWERRPRGGCGMGNPWASYVGEQKTPGEVRVLKAWAEDASEADDARVGAITALMSAAAPVTWWQGLVARTAAGSDARAYALAGWLAAGDVEAVAFLGDSVTADLLLIMTVQQGGLRAAVPALRAYAKKSTVNPRVLTMLRGVVLELAPGGAEVDALIDAGDADSLHFVVHSGPKDVRLLSKLLPALARTEGRLSDDVRSYLQFTLADALVARSPPAVKLAHEWSRPHAVDLSRAPGVSLVLARWNLSEGRVAIAEAVLTSALAHVDPGAKEDSDSGSLWLGQRALRQEWACLKNVKGTGASPALDGLISNLRIGGGCPTSAR